MKLNVFLNSYSETIRFAADEFCRILNQMDSSVKVAFIEEEGSADLKIGVFATDLLPKVDDVALDDAIAISYESGCGYISGINERSVLMAVYKFFEALGVSYVRPGRHGERIPKRNFG